MRKLIVKVIRFLKPSLTGTDGLCEESKLGGWFCLLLLGFSVRHVLESPTGISMIHIYLIALLSILYLLLIGVVKFQEVIEAVKNIKRDGSGNQV